MMTREEIAEHVKAYQWVQDNRSPGDPSSWPVEDRRAEGDLGQTFTWTDTRRRRIIVETVGVVR